MVLYQSKLNIFSPIFSKWVSHLELSQNLAAKYHVISFSKSCSLILYNYFLNDSKLKSIYSITDLGFNYLFNLSFSLRVNNVVNKAL